MFQVFFGAVTLGVDGEGGVAYFAHIGGFALRAVAMLALRATHRLRWEEAGDQQGRLFEDYRAFEITHGARTGVLGR